MTLKPLLLTLLLIITLNANNNLPIHFYEDGKLEKSTFKERASLKIETPNNKNRTTVVTGAYWDGNYSFVSPISKDEFIRKVKRNILNGNGKIEYSGLSYVHCNLKSNGKKYWATITRHGSRKYEVLLVEEKDKIIEILNTGISKKSSMDISTFHNLKFASGEYALLLTSKAEEDLNEIEDRLRKFPSLRIRIEGHTDKHPSPTITNQELSEKRALAVKNALIKRGIKASRLESVGLGDSRLLPHATDAQNRRVEVHPLKPKKIIINMDKFPAMDGYKKIIDKNDGSYIVARYALMENKKGSSRDEIFAHYKKIISHLAGKIKEQKIHKIIFDFEEVSAKLTVVMGAYFISITNKKGEK